MTDCENFDHYQGNDKVILVSNEQHKFHVKKSAAEMSVLVKTMTEDDDVVMDTYNESFIIMNSTIN